MDLKNVAIVGEAFIAGFSLVCAIIGFLRSVLTTKQQKNLRTVLLTIPRAILEAENVFLDGHGEEKKRFAICLLKEYCGALGIEFDRYAKLIEGALEDCLATPQKKLEAYYEENQKQS